MADTIFYITPSVEMLGARISLVELLTHIDRKKFRPVVICHRSGALIDALDKIDVQTHIVRFGNWRKAKYWPLIPFAVRDMVALSRKENARLWHSNEFWSYPYARLSANRTGIPAICHFRCSRTPHQIPPRKIKNYMLPKADAIVTVSRAQKRLFKEFPILRDKIKVVPNGVDFQRFYDADGTSFRNEIGVNSNQHLIGIVGPVSRHKGVEEFVNAANAVLKQYPDAKFVIVGPDRPRAFLDELKAMVTRMGLESSVMFTGFRSDIPEIMSALDLLITPSRVEAFGRVLLEAMAAGTMVIASQVGGIPEVISEKNLGILVPPESPEKLGDAIISAIKDAPNRLKITQTAQNHVKNLFTIENHTRQIEAIYSSFLD